MKQDEYYFNNPDERICTCENSHCIYAEGEVCPDCNGIVYAPVAVQKERVLVRGHFEALPKVLVRSNPIELPQPHIPHHIYRGQHL